MKSRLAKLSLVFAAIGALLTFSLFLFTFLTPMTMCLTFDDDQNAHATIAAPTLEKYGWRGAFNIVTGRLEHPRAKGKMNWSQAKEMLAHGHEIYPHSFFPDPESPTFSHYNLRQLAESGNLSEVERQVSGGKKMIVEKLGITPQFFCLPFNSMNEDVGKIIVANGMRPLNCSRRNFPTHPGREPMSIAEYVKREWRSGKDHVDIMMHGIVRAEGGWEPFEDAAHFDRFCRELKDVENSGIVRIVGYAELHNCTKWGGVRLFRKLVFRVLQKLRII